jgi:carbon monoxide dehydrogenase subunit G
MEPIVSTIDIDRPPGEVFAYATDPAHFPEWQTDIAKVEVEGSGVGARFYTTRQIGPATQTIAQEVVELDAPRRWSARGVGGAMKANGTVTVEPLDSGRRSRITFSLDFEARGPLRAVLPLVVRQTRAGAPRSYQRLKERLERS